VGVARDFVTVEAMLFLGMGAVMIGKDIGSF
jgi:hypothetical protein